jgi:hypothetical protein
VKPSLEECLPCCSSWVFQAEGSTAWSLENPLRSDCTFELAEPMDSSWHRAETHKTPFINTSEITQNIISYVEYSDDNSLTRMKCISSKHSLVCVCVRVSVRARVGMCVCVSVYV